MLQTISTIEIHVSVLVEFSVLVFIVVKVHCLQKTTLHKMVYNDTEKYTVK